MNDTREPGGDAAQEELDLYIDGLLDDERRAAFERRLIADPALAAELELQRSLEARLGVAFPVPDEPAFSAHSSSSPSSSAPSNAEAALDAERPRHAAGRWLTVLRIAAAASLLATLGLWAAGVFDVVDQAPAVVVDAGDPGAASDGPGLESPAFDNPGIDDPGVDNAGVGGPVDLAQLVDPLGPQLPVGACVAHGGLYAELADEWRQALTACGFPHDLAQHFQDSLGQALFADATDELPIEGPFSTQRWPTATLLASPQQPEPILILVDTLARDPQPALEDGSPAHVFRRELGGLVLYEITPWDSPRTLDLFRLR